MATKTEIQNAINTIDDGGLNTAAEMRSVLELIKNAFYPALITDTHLTTNLFSASGSLTYRINVFKIGNVINIIGFVSNTTSEIISNVDICETLNTEYFSETGMKFYANENAKIDILNGVISLNGSIGIDDVINFKLTYKNAD